MVCEELASENWLANDLFKRIHNDIILVVITSTGFKRRSLTNSHLIQTQFKIPNVNVNTSLTGVRRTLRSFRSASNVAFKSVLVVKRGISFKYVLLLSFSLSRIIY